MKISDAEWEVLNTLWDEYPATAKDIVERLSHKEWNHRTIKTLISRLVKKGALTYRQEKNYFLYSPAIQRDSVLKQEGSMLLGKIMDKSSFPVLMQLVEKTKLSQDEAGELIKMLEAKRDDSDH